MKTASRPFTWLLTALLCVLMPCAAYAQLLELDQAIARISIHSISNANTNTNTNSISPQATPVTLPYVWDTQHPQQSGEAVFEIAFALAAPSASLANTVSTAQPPAALAPYALYLARIGTVYEVWLNGSLLSAQGYANASTTTDTRVPSPTDYAKAPRLLPIPWQLLQSENLLRIALRADAGRHGGLSALLIGPQDEVAARYHAALRWRVSGVLAVLVFSVCVALTSALLWLTQPPPDLLERSGRDHLTLWAALGQAAWALVLADQVLERPWLAWPLWGGLVYAATWLAAAMAGLFAYQSLVQVRRAARDTTAAWQSDHAHGQLAHGALRQTWGVPWRAALVAMAMLACIAALLWQWFGLSGDWPSPPWLAYASSLFGLAVAANTLARFRQDSAQVHDLMATLAQRVADKERALQRNYAQLEATARAEESATERARLLREMHDSVGSHIGLALRQIHAKHSAPQVLTTLRACLDQLKLSIDSLQLPAGDVASLLANLRYRIAPRMASAGLQFEWQVAQLPLVARLGPHAMRQLQHLLFDALSAALAGAAGSTLQVQAAAHSGILRITLVRTGAVFAEPIPSAWLVRCAALDAQISALPPTSAQAAGLQIEIPTNGPALR